MELWRIALRNKSSPTACMHKELWSPNVNSWKDTQIPLARSSTLPQASDTVPGRGWALRWLCLPTLPQDSFSCSSSHLSLKGCKCWLWWRFLVFWAASSWEVILSFKEQSWLTFLCLALLEENLACLLSDVLLVVVYSPIRIVWF